jgi:hypothetical protein
MSSADVNDARSFAAFSADALLAEGAVDRVPDETVQELMTAAVTLYAAKIEAEKRFSPFVEGDSVTATKVAVTVTEMLKAVDVELFELGMWQVWGKA